MIWAWYVGVRERKALKSVTETACAVHKKGRDNNGEAFKYDNKIKAGA